jgi:hypothetical protein
MDCKLILICERSMQRKLYSNILKKDVDAINGKGGERSRLLNIVMQVFFRDTHVAGPVGGSHALCAAPQVQQPPVSV